MLIKKTERVAGVGMALGRGALDQAESLARVFLQAAPRIGHYPERVLGTGVPAPARELDQRGERRESERPPRSALVFRRHRNRTLAPESHSSRNGVQNTQNNVHASGRHVQSPYQVAQSGAREQRRPASDIRRAAGAGRYPAQRPPP